MEALSEEKQQLYLSTLTHYADLADRRSCANEYELFINSFAKSLDVVPTKDGDQWVSLYGKDLQSGIAGFGNTPFQSIEALRYEFNKVK